MFDSKVKSLVTFRSAEMQEERLGLDELPEEQFFYAPVASQVSLPGNWFTINYPKNSVADSAFAFSKGALFLCGKATLL